MLGLLMEFLPETASQKMATTYEFVARLFVRRNSRTEHKAELRRVELPLVLMITFERPRPLSVTGESSALHIISYSSLRGGRGYEYFVRQILCQQRLIFAMQPQ